MSVSKEDRLSTSARATFEVDKQGLRQLLERKDKSYIVTELVQNAWDEDSTRVDVTLELLPDQVGMARLVVEDDDPDGFTDLTHAYTLFAPSEKKSQANKRGRFNLGEKLVIAACDRVEISTTTGRIVFDGEGRHHHDSIRTVGSRFEGVLPLTAEEYAVVERVVSTLIPPADKLTTFNGEVVPQRVPVRTFTEAVWTEVAGADEKMKRTIRKTTVSLYDPLPGEEATVYEMGVPVVAADCAWHIDVGQKVPLSLERDNLTPAWLRDIRCIVLNHAFDILGPEHADASWILDGLGDENVTPEAVKAMIDLRFGKAVAYDPSDPEANRLANAEGYNTIGSRSLPKEVWAQVKRTGVLLPAGQVTPSPKNYLPGQAETRKTRPPEKWTAGMQRQADFAKWIADRLLNVTLLVEVIDDPQIQTFEVNYEPEARVYDDDQGVAGRLDLNLRRLGHSWFEKDSAAVVQTLLYAFAHHYEKDRLSANFHQAVARLGQGVVQLALDDAETFGTFRVKS